MTLPKIILIDDEDRAMKSYLQDLEIEFKEIYEVKLIKNIDSAYEFLKNNRDIKIVILDVMMPAGKLLKDVDTDDGLRTGVRFHQKIREIFPDLPIIMFTNVSSEELEDQFKQDKRSNFLHKADYLPFQLADEIKDLLGGDFRNFTDNYVQK